MRRASATEVSDLADEADAIRIRDGIAQAAAANRHRHQMHLVDSQPDVSWVAMLGQLQPVDAEQRL